MATVKVPLLSETYTSVDEVVLNDKSFKQYNGFVDDLGGINVRSGEILGILTNRRIDGLYLWPERGLVSVENGSVVVYASTPTSLTQLSLAVSTLPLGVPVIFCNDANYCFLAAGGKINYINSSGIIAEITDPDAPTNVTHVAFIDGYILCNNGDGKLYWADLNSPFSFAALSFASAEGNPDKIVAIHVLQREIYLIGSVTTEIWQNDGESPFSRIPGGLIEVGCSAPYSVVRTDQALMWLGHNRYFVRFAGAGVERISSKYDKEIQDFPIVSDCVSGRLDENGRTIYLFNFPSVNRTFAYDPQSNDWTERSEWNENAETWLGYDFTSVAYDLVTGRTYIGKDRAKAIAILDKESRVDLIANSLTRAVKFWRRSGNVDYGTSKLKRSEELRIRVKRGTGLSSGTPKLMVRWRNNGSSTWSNIREISLGDIGDTEFIARFLRTGIFRTRQYEISATDNVPIVMAEAEEDITILR